MPCSGTFCRGFHDPKSSSGLSGLIVRCTIWPGSTKQTIEQCGTAAAEARMISRATPPPKPTAPNPWAMAVVAFGLPGASPPSLSDILRTEFAEVVGDKDRTCRYREGAAQPGLGS